jgi:hypothetical protein
MKGISTVGVIVIAVIIVIGVIAAYFLVLNHSSSSSSSSSASTTTSSPGGLPAVEAGIESQLKSATSCTWKLSTSCSFNETCYYRNPEVIYFNGTVSHTSCRLAGTEICCGDLTANATKLVFYESNHPKHETCVWIFHFNSSVYASDLVKSLDNCYRSSAHCVKSINYDGYQGYALISSSTFSSITVNYIQVMVYKGDYAVYIYIQCCSNTLTNMSNLDNLIAQLNPVIS